MRAFLAFLVRDDLQNGDLHQHVWWTWSFRDPAAFPNDPIFAFFSAPLFAPPGHHLIHRLLVPLAPPQAIAETMPFVIAAVVAVLLWLTGRRAASGAMAGGVFAVTFFAVSHGMRDHVEAGLPRAFAMPVLLLYLWSTGADRRWVVGLAFLLGAVFYPPTVVVMALAFLFQHAPGLVRERRAWLRWWPAVPFVVVAALLLLRAYLPDSSIHGPKIDLATAQQMPELGPDGRSRFFADSAREYWFQNQRAGIGDRPATVAFNALVLLAVLVWRRSWLPREVWALLAASLAAFFLAHLTLFALHLPNRYVRVPIKIVEIMLVATISARVLAALVDRARRRWPGLGRARPAVVALGAVAAIGLAISAGERIARDLSRPYDRDRMAAMAFLENMPKDTLVAAHPDDADAVPLLARRSVLASTETTLPYRIGYLHMMRERIAAELAALLATDWSAIDELGERFGVDVFLLDRRRLDSDGWSYSVPYADEQARRFAAGRDDGFVLSDPPAERTLFRSGPWQVIRVGPPRETDGDGAQRGR